MHFRKALATGLALALAACSVSDAPHPAGNGTLMVWPDLLERPRPTPNQTVSYGDATEQVVDVWLPDGNGPHPVVLMVHGGCWQTEIADRTIMNWIADDLRRRGIAVWNIDYRGVDRPGGGYPGTFADVAQAADALRANAAALQLDTSRVVSIGHSAGGHLALWLAARRRLPAFGADPLPLVEAISLGGLQDLELAARPPGSGCGTEIIGRLVGSGSEAGRADPFADTSVARLLPLGVRQILINGREDRIIPWTFAEDYQARARTAGEQVEVRMVPATGHVELIAPETQAWAAAVAEIERALGRNRR